MILQRSGRMALFSAAVCAAIGASVRLSTTSSVSVGAQRESLLGTTASARLDDTRAAFRLVHHRGPVSLTRRLREQARRFFDREAAAARAGGLRRGLHRQGISVTPTMVTMRTHRLRRAGRLPRTSRPGGYGRSAHRHIKQV